MKASLLQVSDLHPLHTPACNFLCKSSVMLHSCHPLCPIELFHCYRIYPSAQPLHTVLPGSSHCIHLHPSINLSMLFCLLHSSSTSPLILSQVHLRTASLCPLCNIHSSWQLPELLVRCFSPAPSCYLQLSLLWCVKCSRCRVDLHPDTPAGRCVSITPREATCHRRGTSMALSLLICLHLPLELQQLWDHWCHCLLFANSFKRCWRTAEQFRKYLFLRKSHWKCLTFSHQWRRMLMKKTKIMTCI